MGWREDMTDVGGDALVRAVKDLKKANARIAELEATARERELEGYRSLKPVEVPVEKHKAGDPGYPITMWSDWHWGETVDPAQMGGTNAFNYDIAHARVRQLVNGTIGLLKNYSGARPHYSGITVALGGDMISGGIHDELEDTDWTPKADQVVQVTEALAGALTTMANTFGQVYVPCVVGNHGRNSQKPRNKGFVRESMEWVIYKMLERHFRGDDRFTFIIPETSTHLFDIHGFRFNLQHGDRLGVRGGDGIIGAVGPITRGAIKQHRRMSQVGLAYDFMMIGHWHQYTPIGDSNNTLVNGTLKGYDEYAQNTLGVPFAKPSQALLLVSPKHGIAAQWRVDCGNLTEVE